MAPAADRDTPSGIPVRVQVLPAGVHALTPLHERAVVLPPGARRFGDQGANSAADAARLPADRGVRLIPVRRANMRPHAWVVDDSALPEYRHTSETVNRQCEQMGRERLYARTHTGFELKVLAAIVALACTNMD
ncbi:MAG: hypothetical protein MI924_33355 [Chloroflexales bacterium]|nr:hypothetical protein [Chloroflexales bacterium]